MNLGAVLRIVVFDASPIVAWGFSQYFRSCFGQLALVTTSTIADVIEHIEEFGSPDVLVTGPSLQDVIAGKAVQQILTRNCKTKWLAIHRPDDGSASFSPRAAGAHGVVSQFASIDKISQALDYLNRGVEWFYDGSPSPSLETRAWQLTSAVTLGMTPRQDEIYRLVVRGLSNKSIAQALGIQVSTVKEHMTQILGRLGVSSRTQAVAKMSVYVVDQTATTYDSPVDR